MSSEEWTYWQAYYQLDPWGEERADYRIAVLDALFANAWRGKNSRKFEPKDFMPEFGRASGEQTPEEMRAICEMWGALGSAGAIKAP